MSATYNDGAYYARRDALLACLRGSDEPLTCREIAAAIGGTTHEIRAKLMSLRIDGHVRYEAREQRWSPRP